MVKFGTQEWVDLYVDAINSNEAYAKAADWWEGDFIFQVDPHGGLDKQLRLWVGLYHGKCTGCKILKESDEVKLLDKGEAPSGQPFEAEYIYAARIDVWEQIMKKELDPIRALLSGKAKVTGDMAKVLRATEAAKELVVSASTIETEFYD
ncbi:MAG: SCP2 sterol-binding domain-containing protein [Candidatus Thorarchaeota archaeon]|jgi:putative sterol carrier protein